MYEVPRCKRNEKRDSKPCRDHPRDDAANQKGEAREQIEEQGLLSAPTPVNQHTEVPELLRYLVCSGGKPSCESEPDIREEYGSYAKAAEKVVQAISDQDQVRQGSLQSDDARWQ